MEWFKKHTDAVIVLGAILSSVLWMNSKFNSIDHCFHKVDKQIMELEKEVAIIKTVLILKNVYPADMVVKIDEK